MNTSIYPNPKLHPEHGPAQPTSYEFVQPTNNILNLIAKEVIPTEIDSQEIQLLIDGMFKIAYGEQGDKERKTMVGLAAPQIGVNERIIIAGINAVGLGEQPELKVFINPEITEVSDETEEGREGCYSTDKVCGIVDRSKTVTLRAYDRYGNEATETYEGFPARVLQHEIDHLNGIRFPDRITDDAKLHWVETERFGEYREQWAEWEVRCTREQWEAIKTDSVT